MRIASATPPRLQENLTPPAKAPSTREDHHHGWTGTALHVGHDVAMIGMSLPSGHHHQAAPFVPSPMDICGGKPPQMDVPMHDHSAHDHSAMGGHQHGGGGLLNQTTAGLSAIVAVGAGIHGLQMVTSKDTLTRLEGANHLLMSASCGVMSAQMYGGNAALGPWSTGLMAAHGLGEVALGVHQLVQGVKTGCAHHKMMGLTKAVHGGCLAAAQAFPGAALPLYLAMGAATTVQIAMAQQGH